MQQFQSVPHPPQPRVLAAFLMLPNGQVQLQANVRDPAFLVQAARQLLGLAIEEMGKGQAPFSNIMLPNGEVI